jgi:dipeptidyl aminopeptidase/acylaminoacyl peptidase
MMKQRAAMFVITSIVSSPFGAFGQEPPAAGLRISEEVSPIELIQPVAQDGHVGQALLRKPPGNGPFPGIVLIPGGVVPPSLEEVRNDFSRRALPAHFLGEGYVVATLTHRRRDTDVQSQVARDDAVAVVDYLKRLPIVDADSVGIYACSSGGDLALAVASVEEVAAIVAEEPASPMFMGVLTNELLESPEDLLAISTDPLRFYTPEARNVARDRIDGIQSPILILQGDVPIPQAQDVNNFNELVLIPELRAAGKSVEVITYRGGYHCFANRSVGSVDLALRAIRDAETFFRRHTQVDPKPFDR